MTTAEATTNAEGVTKTVDMAMGQAAANDTAAKPATPDPTKGVEGGAPDATAPAPVAEDKLARARAVARSKSEEHQRRMVAQADAQRREQDRLQAHSAAKAAQERADALQSQLDALRDPMAALAHLEKLGLPAKTLVERSVAQSTPEAKLKAELEARLEERVSEVQRQYQERIDKIERERQTAQNTEALARAEKEFLAAAANETTYPAVARIVALGDEWRGSILAEATRILRDAHQKTGHEYTDAEVLTYLDQKYSKLMPSPNSGHSTSNGTKEAIAGAGAQETNAAGGTRTLTNAATQAKGSLPPDFDSLSDRDQKAALAAMYRASRKP